MISSTYLHDYDLHACLEQVRHGVRSSIGGLQVDLCSLDKPGPVFRVFVLKVMVIKDLERNMRRDGGFLYSKRQSAFAVLYRLYNSW